MVTYVFPLFQRLVHQLDTDYIIGSECATEPSTFISKDYTRISQEEGLYHLAWLV